MPACTPGGPSRTPTWTRSRGPRWPAGPGGRPAEAALSRLRGVLPADVVVRRAAPAPAGFDARFSASWRRYRYRLCDRPSDA